MASGDSSSSASSTEDSFRVQRTQKKTRRPVISSDSESEVSVIEESDVEVEAVVDNAPSRKSFENSINLSRGEPDLTEDEESDWQAQAFSEDDDETSDPAQTLGHVEPNHSDNVVQNTSVQKTGDDQEAVMEPVMGNGLSVANTSIYRNTIIEDSDDEGNTDKDDIIENSDDELDVPPKKTPQKSPRGREAHDYGVKVIEKSQSIVELSSDEESEPSRLVQTDLKSFITPAVPQSKQKPQGDLSVAVSSEQYHQQRQKLMTLEADLMRAKNALRVIKLENLPDKGVSLVQKEKSLQNLLELERIKLAKMTADDKQVGGVPVREKVAVDWKDIEEGLGAVGPRTFGQKGVARFNVEKQLAVETLDSLHKSLQTCPKEDDFVEDPKGLKIPLMPHQKHAVAWLLWREKQKPSGGLLADDMGLGKTLTMISLILKSRELYPEEDSEKENYRDKYPGGTLVVCPASLMNQWSGEIENRTKRGLLSVELYHGAKRETKAKRLARHDVVITTYTLLSKENDKNGPMFGVRWRRIILDEAHQIRNFKSQMAVAAFRLSGKSRWSLTGTPIQNKELDMYSILKFLRCAPFDDLQVWKRWMADKTTGGEMRLHTVISSLIKRRTKAELMQKGSLQNLPTKTWELITVKLEKDEMDVYQKVLIFSRTLFAQFLHQRAEKDQDAYDLKFGGAPPNTNGEYFKMRNKLLKLNRVKDVSQHEILVLLLRLRQICCHPTLIKQMLQGDEDLGNAEDYEEPEEMNLLEQLNKLNIDDEDEHHPADGASAENVGLKEASKGFLNPSNPVFKSDRASSKVKALIKLIKETVGTGDKAIVVSQWTSFLDLIAYQMKDENLCFDSLNGKIPVHKRMPIVDNFNDPRSPTKVLLLSLTAGGVGLNLIGANHLFLLDLHWNPQLESQAQDRIYRMGQTKPIFVYKLMAEGTIEERIKALQDRKLDIADSMLTGSKRVSDKKLSLQDLKLLFDFK